MSDDNATHIAIVGLAGQFPGSPDVETFWKNLAQGIEGISFFADDEREVPTRERGAGGPRLVNAMGVLADIDRFDAPFFNIPASDAAWMDPQHRLFLECAWAAIEHAGYDVETLSGPVAVYAGVNTNMYLLGRLEQLMASEPQQFLQALVGNERDFLATRVCHRLNLRGEGVTVQSSCSTSLVAVHLACQSLLLGQCDMALAGGVSVRIPQKTGYVYQEGMIASPDGHCRAFDKDARGTLPGNGLGIVVLKRLADALRDRDTCHAVIRGSWINNDGRRKVGFTAPSVSGQAEVIARALAMAGVSADTIGFVEAHGTGTPIGDPIEVEALTEAFRRDTARTQYCALGAVKTNIGHLDTAAGIAGLIKATLSLRHKLIPPTLHFAQPNPAIDFASSPFFVNATALDWPAGPAPRRAGVSSFGIGGTNAHVVLEEVSAHQASPPRAGRPRPAHIVTLSARTPAALEQRARRLDAHVSEHPADALQDIAFTQNVGRAAFGYRAFSVCADHAGLRAGLARVAARPPHAAPDRPPRVAFLFPGQGSQSLGMGRQLYEHEPTFRAPVDACARLLEAETGERLLDLIYPREPSEPAAARLAQPQCALPALLAIQYAYAQLWMSWGITPDAMIGHSYGEYVAACLAGVMSLDDALRLALARGRLMQRMAPGGMLAVVLGEDDARRYGGEGVELAAVNSSSQCVLSGPIDALDRLQQRLTADGVSHRRVPVPYAYHSALLDPVLGDLRAVVAALPRQAPRLPYVSTLTGTWIEPGQPLDPSYWSAQMRGTVRFHDGLLAIVRDEPWVLLEVGAGQTLTKLARQLRAPRVLCAASSAGSDEAASGHAALFEALGTIWAAGVRVDWTAVHADDDRRIPLPTYPFERRSYWVDHDRRRSAEAAPPAQAAVPAVAQAAVQEPEAVDDSERASLPEPYEAPRDEVEQAVTRVWREVLGLKAIGVNDSLMDLGGDSLAAMRILSRLRQRWPSAIALEQILAGPTVAQLASMLRASDDESRPRPEEAGGIEALDGAEPNGPIVLSFAQEWFWSLAQLWPESAAYHLPLAMRLGGRLAIDSVRRALTEIVRRHDALRTAFPAVDGRPVPIVAPPGPVPLPAIDLAGVDPVMRVGIARRLASRVMRQPFDLSRAHHLRAALLRLDEDDHVLLLVLPHIVSDAWSTNILLRELSVLYQAFSAGQPSPLPALPLQYADIARLQREAVSDADKEATMRYWRAQLATPSPILRLGARPRPDRQTDRGGRRPLAFADALTPRIEALGRRTRSTPYTMLLAAFLTVLTRRTGQTDLTVGMPTAGRDRPEAEGLIGCFVDTLPLRVDLSGNPRFGDLLDRVSTTLRAAHGHHALPFSSIVQQLRPDRSAGHTPLYQVVFDLNNTPRGTPPALPGLTPRPFGGELGTAKTDLVVDLWRAEAGWRGSIEYRTDLFEAAEVDALAADVEAVLAAVADDESLRVAAVPLAAGAADDPGREQSRRDRLRRIKQAGVEPAARIAAAIQPAERAASKES